MPVWLRVILIIGLLFALIVAGVVGAGWFWWHRNGAQVIERAKAAVAEGEKLAESTDQAGCLEAAFARNRGCATIGCGVDRNLFFKGCVRKAAETAGFCAGVPAETEIMASVNYRVDQCTKRDAAQDQTCQQLYGEVQKFCAGH